MTWLLADRTLLMQTSAIRDILKLADGKDILSMAGGLPSQAAFPVDAVAYAADKVLRRAGGAQALQYGSSEGLPPLRQWVAKRLTASGHAVSPDQVLITTGSQQALDLLGKVLMQPGRSLGVEQPSYLGALQAFQLYEPQLHPLPSDADGPLPAGLAGRLSYLNPNFQNPTGRCLPEHRRAAMAQVLQDEGGALIEDDPYGELWFDQAPPPSLASRCPGHVVYLGSFSKVLAPGLRVGYMVLPSSDQADAAALNAKVVQAKQAADLHTSTLSQHIVLQMLESGFDWHTHLQGVRALYRRQRDAMAAALKRHMPANWTWTLPSGGMFFWLMGPQHVDTQALLKRALAAGVAFVPGASFYPGAHQDAQCSMRLSFVTLSESQIHEAVARLASCLSDVAMADVKTANASLAV